MTCLYNSEKMLSIFLVMTIATVIKASHFEFDASHGFGHLQFHPRLISQSVQLKEVPTKIIRITKTVAIKVPVPYPVEVPHHYPVPVPVTKPVAVPVPQIVEIPRHVPYEVQKPYPVEVHQQVPLIISKPIAVPHPVPVPHPVTINKPVYYPVPHPVPYYHHQSGESSHNDYSDSNGGTDHNYLSRSFHRDHLKDPTNDESNAQTFQVSQHDLTQGKNYGTEQQEFSSTNQNYNQTPQDFSKESKSNEEISTERNYSSSQDYNGKNYREQY